MSDGFTEEADITAPHISNLYTTRERNLLGKGLSTCKKDVFQKDVFQASNIQSFQLKLQFLKIKFQ